MWRKFAERKRSSRLHRLLSNDVEKWKLNTIVLDAGHGGKDPGAIGGSGTREKDVVLNIVHDLGAFIIAEMAGCAGDLYKKGRLRLFLFINEEK